MTNRKKVDMGNILQEAGYADSVAENPKLVTESVGFKAALAKHNLTEEKFAEYLSYDLENKPKERLGELKLMADVLSLTSSKINVTVEKGDEAMERLAGIMAAAEELTPLESGTPTGEAIKED